VSVWSSPSTLLLLPLFLFFLKLKPAINPNGTASLGSVASFSALVLPVESFFDRRLVPLEWDGR
jgi:hypothetical protein